MCVIKQFNILLFLFALTACSDAELPEDYIFTVPEIIKTSHSGDKRVNIKGCLRKEQEVKSSPRVGFRLRDCTSSKNIKSMAFISLQLDKAQGYFDLDESVNKEIVLTGFYVPSEIKTDGEKFILHELYDLKLVKN